MKSVNFVFALLIAVFAVHHAALAQQDTIGIRTILAKQAKFINNYPVEKVYLHLDKPYYAAGDTLWFKAYVTIDLHQPSILSKIVYVDLLSSTDSLVQSLRLPVINGFAQGNITLNPLYIRQGNYHIRAYTQWMRNFDPAYFFNKTIPIGNTDKLLSARAAFTASGKGNAVNARVVYKDADGNPYAGKKVSWRVETLEKDLGKGRGVTDQNGALQISIPPGKADDAGAATLITSIDADGKKPVSNSFQVRPAGRDNDVQFFPEGGRLIAGNTVKVAFKALRPDGLGTDVKGTVTDNEGKTCAMFTSQHLGMGVFAMVPENGKTYKAAVTFANGTQQTYPLPAVQQSGIGITIADNDAGNVNIKVSANQTFFDQNKGKVFYLIGKIGEAIGYAAQTALQTKDYTIAIPKAKLATGILQVTLFADNGQPLSERLVFVQNNDLLNLSARTDRTTYGKRQRVKFSIVSKNQAQPAEANLSVAVIDENKVPADETAEATILSSMLLTSDLKGYIEKPGYYFNRTDDKTASDLDVLMLTQGYRRFTYTDLLAGRLPQVRFPAEEGITVAGTLRTTNGLPFAKGNVRLTMPDRNFSLNAVTDIEGRFTFSKVPVIDSSKVVISARNNYHSNTLMIMVDNATIPGIIPGASSPDNVADIDSTFRIYLKNSKSQYYNSRLLKEVVITAKPVVKLPSHTDYPALAGLNPIADYLITGDRLTACPQVLSCLEGMAFGLTYRDNNFYVTRDYNQGNRTPAAIYLNGMPIDVNNLNGVNSADVASVEVFTKDDLGLVSRINNTNGVLVINTKSKEIKGGKKISLAELQDMLPRNDEVTISPQGYTIARQFYSPKYDPTKASTIGVDYRTTIYWNPQVRTDKTGAAAIEFFNADGTGSYRAVIEGMDAEGHIGRAVYRYKVE